ncbi:Tau-tubulin kinase 2 [Rhizophlyctis rosea]|nr:Tau-tubulin kinase 2 [Rhizophlyctis rosea]
MATTVILARDMLRALEALHEVGIVHRDVKPANFCLEHMETNRPERARCYLVDFGLARRYKNPSGKVREPRPKVGFRGTPRYASLRAHQGQEVGRVDDLLSLFYIVWEFLEGHLPWSRHQDKKEIAEIKARQMDIKEVQKLPKPMVEMFRYLLTLSYYDRPDYDFIESLLQRLLVHCGKDWSARYDWETLEDVSTSSSVFSKGQMSAGLAGIVQNSVAPSSAEIKDSEQALGGKLDNDRDGRDGERLDLIISVAKPPPIGVNVPAKSLPAERAIHSDRQPSHQHSMTPWIGTGAVISIGNTRHKSQTPRTTTTPGTNESTSPPPLPIKADSGKQAAVDICPDRHSIQEAGAPLSKLHDLDMATNDELKEDASQSTEFRGSTGREESRPSKHGIESLRVFERCSADIKNKVEAYEFAPNEPVIARVPK